MWMRWGLLVAVLAIGGQAHAADCTPDAMQGIWALASVKADEPGVQAFYERAPNEVMRFGPGDAFMYVASSAPFTHADATVRLDAADKADGVSYSFLTEGAILMLMRNGAPFQMFQCAFSEAADGEAKAGDMILSAAPGAPALKRIQRRLAP